MRKSLKIHTGEDVVISTEKRVWKGSWLEENKPMRWEELAFTIALNGTLENT